MSSLARSEKNDTVVKTAVERTAATTTSSRELSNLEGELLHFVPRNEVLSDNDHSREAIIGYDADQMRARATLSYEEEKKLLHRIDWHLLPLLSIMYMIKSIGASSVC